MSKTAASVFSPASHRYPTYPRVFTAPVVAQPEPEAVPPVRSEPAGEVPLKGNLTMFLDDEENPFLDRNSASPVDNRPIVMRNCSEEFRSMLPVPRAGESFLKAIGLPDEVYKTRHGHLAPTLKIMKEYQAAYLLRRSLDDESQVRYIDITEEPRQVESFRFMSYELIADEMKRKATIQDDMESFAWVFLYGVLRFTNHNAARVPGVTDPSAKRLPNLPALLNQIFNRDQDIEAKLGPGFTKMLLLLTGRPLPLDFEVKQNRPLTLVAQSIFDPFEVRLHFLMRTVPKRIRSLSRAWGVDYNTAREVYLASEEYEDELDKRSTTHDDLTELLEIGLAQVDWPVDDKSTDGVENWLLSKSLVS